ncbi:MAG: M12 family metallo-peptidase [Bacteroidota bacterium]|nr:M12 family metallo-peptidase [Bacteroidota bacterium]
MCIRNIVLLLSFFVSARLVAQVEVVRLSDLPRYDARNYIPYDSNQYPVKHIRIAIHLFQCADGTGNFGKDAWSRDVIGRILNHSNGKFRNVELLYPVSPDPYYVLIPDSRIHIVLDTIYEHRDDTDQAFNVGLGIKKPNAPIGDSLMNEGRAFTKAENMWDKYVANLPIRQRDSAIHVFFFEANTFKNKGMARDLFNGKWLYVLGAYGFAASDSTHPDHWTIGNTLAHEIGHSLGLQHPFHNNDCTDLPNTSMGQSNNVMDYWPKAGNGLSPQQMGYMHLGLSGLRGNVHQVVVPYWLKKSTQQALLISGTDTVKWLGDKFINRDIDVQAGSTLFISSQITAAPNCVITIMPNASVVIAKTAQFKNINSDQYFKIVEKRRFLRKTLKGELIDEAKAE